MNRYKLHQPKTPIDWSLLRPGLQLKHKKTGRTITLKDRLIGPLDKKEYWNVINEKALQLTDYLPIDSEYIKENYEPI